MENKIKNIIKKYLVLCLGGVFLAACGSSENGGGSGTISLGLTDQPTEDYSAVYVTINEVRIHASGDASESDSGWVTIASFPGGRTINLLDLRNGVVLNLGIAPLPVGNYTQIRLIIGTTPDSSPNIDCLPHFAANYVKWADTGEYQELTIPSGEQTGIKIVCAGQCNIAENQTTEIILDFDAAQSVVVAGNSGKLNLKPTIKVLTTEDFAIVTGTVTNSADLGPIDGATVSAQTFDGAVTVHNATQSDEEGFYELFLKPGLDYNLEAHQVIDADSAFGLQAVNLVPPLAAGEVRPQDFSLTETGAGTLSGTVGISGITQPTFANISFQEGTVLPGEMVEVDFRDVLVPDDLTAEGYSAELPIGTYTVVASTCGFDPIASTPAVLPTGVEVVVPPILF